MNHNDIQKNILNYTDGNLSGQEMDIIREHLNICPVCKKNFEKISAVWKSENIEKQTNPSPALWAKLETQIREYEQKQDTFIFNDIKNHIYPLLRPIFLFLVIFIIITSGYYIENFISNGTNSNSDSYDEISKIFYIDKLKFSALESINGDFFIAFNDNAE